MSVSSARTRVLIIGCDYQVFHLYWRYYSQKQDYEMCGFIAYNCETVPVKSFKGYMKNPHSVFHISNLEKIIEEKRIKKCLIHVQNAPIPNMQSIINRILSTGTCSVEFLPRKSLIVKSFKPVITITSLAPKTGKTQLTRYFCSILRSEHRKVAVIMTIAKIQSYTKVFNISECPHYEYGQNDAIPADLHTIDDETTIKNYQISGAHRIFLTADIRRAVISAEQIADIIIIDSNNCSQAFVDADSTFCVVSPESLTNVKKTTLWPGLLNIMESTNIVVISNDRMQITEEKRRPIIDLLKNSKVYFALSHAVIEDSHGSELFDKKVLAIDQDNSQEISMNAAKEMGACDFVDPSPYISDSIKKNGDSVVAMLPKNDTLSQNTINQTKLALSRLAKTINSCDADVVIISFNHEIPGLDHFKTVLYSSPEIDDVDGKLYKYLSRYFTKRQTPTLKNHFEAQVDIIMSLAAASDKELNVPNNDVANREAFCKLFLQSHLPKGYRIITGEITDCCSNHTGKLDVIIVNSRCPRLTIDITDAIIAPVPADNVLCVIEVKSMLTSDALKKSIAHLRAVKALMPSHLTLQLQDGRIVHDPLEGKIITGIFSFEKGVMNESKILETLSAYPNVIDFIVIPGQYAFFSEDILKVCGMSIQERCSSNGYAKFTTKGMGLALMFGILNSIAAIRRFSGVNCVRYLSGNWGEKRTMLSKNITGMKWSLDKLDKYALEMKDESKKQFFRTKSRYIKMVESIAKNSMKLKQSGCINDSSL